MHGMLLRVEFLRHSAVHLQMDEASYRAHHQDGAFELQKLAIAHVGSA